MSLDLRTCFTFSHERCCSQLCRNICVRFGALSLSVLIGNTLEHMRFSFTWKLRAYVMTSGSKKKRKKKKGGSRGPGRVETPVFLSHLRALSLSSSLLVNHCFHSVLSCRKWWSVCVFVERESERERERDKEGNPWESVIHQRDTAPTPP